MNPTLFIVGCPRSGTTLLQRLVDAHPQMAVTLETHWVPRWFDQRPRKGITPDGLATKKFLRKLTNHPRFSELGIRPDKVRKMIKGVRRAPYDRLVSSLYELYGQKRGKPIVGDKTPGYARELPVLHHLWPTARFVHLIRDGYSISDHRARRHRDCCAQMPTGDGECWETMAGDLLGESWCPRLFTQISTDALEQGAAIRDSSVRDTTDLGDCLP
jgi:hypothetical protein